jgi:hypothetical protein
LFVAGALGAMVGQVELLVTFAVALVAGVLQYRFLGSERAAARRAERAGSIR